MYSGQVCILFCLCLQLIDTLICQRVKEGCFFFAKSLGLAAMLSVFICLSLSLHKHSQHGEREMENIGRWTQSATTRVNIHTQACYKTFSMLIFTGPSVSLPLRNPIRETCSIKGFRKSLRRSTRNMSALEVPSVFFFSSLIQRAQYHVFLTVSL